MRNSLKLLTLGAAVYALLALAPAGAGIDTVMVLGLFKDKAVVSVNGKSRTLSLGQTSPEGVTLISANSDSAVLEIAGQRKTYALGGQIGGKFTGPKHTQAQIYPDAQGMYMTAGSINGFPVTFLVDTGATLIAMNTPQAKRLGIQYRLDGKPVTTSTASGIATGYQVTLQRVRVGEIELRDIDAVVLEGNNPAEVLLGMSFLGRLEMQRSGQVMELKKKH